MAPAPNAPSQGSRGWVVDRDADGHGDQRGRLTRCADPSTPQVRFVTSGDDCDDLIVTVHPGALEDCDGFDKDCDGVIDDGCLCTVHDVAYAVDNRAATGSPIYAADLRTGAVSQLSAAPAVG